MTLWGLSDDELLRYNNVIHVWYHQSAGRVVYSNRHIFLLKKPFGGGGSLRTRAEQILTVISISWTHLMRIFARNVRVILLEYTIYTCTSVLTTRAHMHFYTFVKHNVITSTITARCAQFNLLLLLVKRITLRIQCTITRRDNNIVTDNNTNNNNNNNNKNTNKKRVH